MKKNTGEEQVQKAYIYLVKTPSSNDLTVCASDSVFYPGTHVVSPTRYGLDMGVIVGSASNIGRTYKPGCAKCKGACHFAPTRDPERDEDQPLVAAGAIEEDEVVFEEGGRRLSLGPLPEFEVKSETKTSFDLEEEDGAEDSNVWDQAYEEPQMVEVDGDIPWISHMATPEELQRYAQNNKEEQDAIRVCREKIEKHKLDMKLVTAHFLLSEPKALFFFTADDRVDFRELVKDLVSVFRMRIELRQIGVRDESRVLGGLAVCGRDFCCHCVSDKLNPVTIKMAKEQNLSLNSMKISGPCGRLLCCLSYEYDFYCEEKLAYPPEGSRLRIGGELFRVQEVNILSHKITVSGSEGRSFLVPREEVYFNSDSGHWEVDRDFQEELLSN